MCNMTPNQAFEVLHRHTVHPADHKQAYINWNTMKGLTHDYMNNILVTTHQFLVGRVGVVSRKGDVDG